MDSTPVNPFSLILKSSRPGVLLAAGLFYLLGAGVAQHQGQSIRWPAFLAGLGLVWLLLLGGNCLKRFYDPPLRGEPETPSLARQQAEHLIFLLGGMAFLITGAGLTTLLFVQGTLEWTGLMVLGGAVALALALGVPPFRLVYSGYGELVETALITLFVPVIGQLLQLATIHPLLIRLIFPLFLAYLAMALALSLEHYAAQLKNDQRTLIIRAGWEWGLRLHNYLLAAAYLMIPVLVIMGLPWSFAWRAFLALPVSLYQVWLMHSIAQGAPPNWRMLRLAAVVSWMLILYQWIAYLWL